MNLRARPLLLSTEECVEGDIGHLADLEPDAGDVADGVTLTSESADQHLVVLLNKVQATVVGDKSCDLLAILDQLHTNALSMERKEGMNSEEQIFLPKLYLIAELGCLASTPTFSRTIPCKRGFR